MEVNSYSGTPKRLKTSRMACLTKVEKVTIPRLHGNSRGGLTWRIEFWTIDIRNININIRHGVAALHI